MIPLAAADAPASRAYQIEANFVVLIMRIEDEEEEEDVAGLRWPWSQEQLLLSFAMGTRSCDGQLRDAELISQSLWTLFNFGVK